jgi:hypothetical protein
MNLSDNFMNSLFYAHPGRLFLIVLFTLFIAYYFSKEHRNILLKYVRIVGLFLLLFAVAKTTYNVSYYVSSVDIVWPLEPQLLSVGALASRGEAIYPTKEEDAFYGQVYGPLIYQAFGWAFNLFSPNITVAKIVCVSALFLSLFVWFYALYDSKNKKFFLEVFFCFLMMFLYFGIYTYNIRPDTLIFMGTVIACLSLFVRGFILSTILLVMGTTIVFSLKITGVLYLLPIYLCFAGKYRRLFATIGIGLLSLWLGVLFMLYYGQDTAGYFFLLTNTSDALPMSFKHAPFFIQFILITLAPLFCLLFLKKQKEQICESSSHKSVLRQIDTFSWDSLEISVLALLLSMIGTGYLAGRLIAANHHLIPYFFVISCVLKYQYNKLNAQTPSQSVQDNYFRVPLYAGAISFGLFIALAPYHRVDWFRSPQNSPILKIKNDILSLHQKYQGKKIHIGAGETDPNRSDGASSHRHWLVFEGHPFLFESTTAMELALGKVDVSQKLIRLFEKGSVDIWLIPRDETPFAFRSSYDKSQVFTNQTIEIFLKTHTLIEKTKFFDVYMRKSSPF